MGQKIGKQAFVQWYCDFEVNVTERFDALLVREQRILARYRWRQLKEYQRNMRRQREAGRRRLWAAVRPLGGGIDVEVRDGSQEAPPEPETPTDPHIVAQ